MRPSAIGNLDIRGWPGGLGGASWYSRPCEVGEDARARGWLSEPGSEIGGVRGTW